MLKLRRSFESASKNAGIAYGRKVEGGLNFHDIRATFKTNMLRAGVTKSVRDKIVGHSPEGMDKHYLRLKNEDLRQAMDKYTVWFDDQFQNVDQTGP